jgi:hypothetical protein
VGRNGEETAKAKKLQTAEHFNNRTAEVRSEAAVLAVPLAA